MLLENNLTNIYLCDNISPCQGDIMFKLTDEQIDYIVEMYGGTKGSIRAIEKKINLIGVIEDEEDYYEVVANVVSQRETFLMNAKTRNSRRGMTIDQIIECELNRKYNNFEDSKDSIKIKMKRI